MKPPTTALEVNSPEHYSGIGQLRVAAPQESTPKRQDSLEAFVREGFAARPLAIMLAQRYQLPFKAYLDFSLIDTSLLADVSSEYAQRTHVLPLYMVGNILVAAIADPSNYEPIDNLTMLFRTMVRPVVIPLDILDYVIARLYCADNGQDSGPLIRLQCEQLEVCARELSRERMDLLQWDDAPVARLLDAVISETIAEHGEQICLEPFERELRARYLAENKWYDLVSLPKCLEKAVISCVKVMAGLSSAESGERQEGQIRLLSGDFDAAVRALVVPELSGELVTLAFDCHNGEPAPEETMPSGGAQPTLDKDVASEAFPHCARCGDAIVLADALFCRRCGFRLQSRFRFRDRIRTVQSFLHSAGVIIHG